MGGGGLVPMGLIARWWVVPIWEGGLVPMGLIARWWVVPIWEVVG